MKIRILKCSGNEWYSKCIGKDFIVHSESRKGGRGKYVVRLEKEDRWLINGYMYGWVDKKHCILLKPLGTEFKQIAIAINPNIERIPMEVPQEVKENIKSMNYIIDENNNVSIEIEYQVTMSLEDKTLLNMCIAESFKKGLKQAHDEDILKIFGDIEIKVKEVEQ